MNVIRGTANAILMVTLVKPVVRVFVARWRKRMQESAATTMGIPMQELMEAALIEELGGPVAVSPAEPTDLMEDLGGRSTVRTVLLAGIVIVAVSGAAVAVAGLIKRRREQAERDRQRELVAVPIEAGPSETERVAEAVELTSSTS